MQEKGNTYRDIDLDQLTHLLGQRSLAPSFQRDPKESTETFDTTWHLPTQLPVFSGRQTELAQLAASFESSNQPCIIRHAKKISGTGGIGKTQLAIEFAHRMLKAARFKKIIWLNADTSVTNQLHNEVMALAQTVGLANISSDSRQAMQAIYGALSKHSPCLVVMDNAVDRESLQGYLPVNQPGISILITTRDANTWSEQFEQVILDIFSLEEACEYFAKVLKHYYEPTAAKDLATTLGRFPLALAQAAGYIVSRNISILDYLSLYSQQQKIQQKLLDTQGFQAEPHKQTIWITVNLCMEQLTKANSTELLVRCALLSAQSPIDKELLACAGFEVEESIEAIISELQNYSLIDPSLNGSYVQIHQLVQDIVLLAAIPKGIDVDEQLLGLMDQSISYLSRILGDPKSSVKRDRVLPHTEKICLKVEYFADNNKHQTNKQNNINTAIIIMKLTANIAFFEQANYESCRKASMKVIERKEFLPDLSDLHKLAIVQSYANLSLALSAMGKASSCVIAIKDGIEKCSQYFTENDQNNLFTAALLLSTLAFIHFDQGNYQQSYNIYTEALKKYDKLDFKKFKEAILRTRYQVALVCSALDYYDEAAKHFADGYGFFIDNYEADSLILATKKIDLSGYYIKTDRLEEAKKLIDESYKVLVDKLGEHHVEVASLLTNLANYHLYKGNKQSYHDTQQRAYETHRIVSGEDHPYTIINLVSLATAKYNLGDISTAIDLLTSSLAKLSTVYSDNNYYVGETLRGLAMCYLNNGDWDQAEALLVRTLSNVRYNFPNNFQRNEQVLNLLNDALLKQRKFQQAYQHSCTLIELYNQNNLGSSIKLADFLIKHFFIELMGNCNLVEARKALINAKKIYIAHGTEHCQEDLAKVERLFHDLDEMSTVPLSVALNKSMQGRDKDQKHELMFEPEVLMELHQSGRVDSLLKVQLFLDQLLVLEYYDGLDIVSQKILEQKLFVETILPYYTRACIELRYLDTALTNLKSCLQIDPSDNAMKMKEKLDGLMKESESLIKQFNIGKIKLERNQLANRDILALTKCAFELGKYQAILEILDKYQDLFSNDSSLLAVLEFHRAKAYFMLAEFPLAKLAIEKSIALKENDTARAWYKKIVIGFEIDELSKLIFKEFDWPALRLANKVQQSYQVNIIKNTM